MNNHPFESTTPGRLLLVICKLVMPLVLITLLVVTPTLIPRRIFLKSYLLDLVIRLGVTGLLSAAFWALPDLAHKFTPRRRGWSSRIWVQLGSTQKGKWFLTGYAVFAGAVVLFVFGLSAWSLTTFLPDAGAARWLLAILFALQFGAVYALQYHDLHEKAVIPPGAARTSPGASSRLISRGNVYSPTRPYPSARRGEQEMDPPNSPPAR